MSESKHLRNVLAMGVSVVALSAIAAPALAQTRAPAAPAAPAAPTADQGVGGADIIVTAEHRQTRLQKVPVAVSVFTGAARDRAGISTVQDVTNFAPGFTYNTVTVNAGMRGVTRQSFNVTDDSRVTAYEDEFFVYSPYNLAESSLFLTQEQIERGPQNIGGRNAEGGSIDMINVRPTDHPYAEVRAGVGNYDSANLEAAASDEIAPGLDARIAGSWYYQGQGYYKNLSLPGESEGHKINDFHIESSFDLKLGSNSDLYVRAYAAQWVEDEGEAGSRQGFTNGQFDETNLTDPNAGAAASLFVNPNFGLAALPQNASSMLGAGSQRPTSVTLFNPGVTGNPSQHGPGNFVAPLATQTTLSKFRDLNYIYTYHFPDADLRYIGGVQGYDYTLDEPDEDSNVKSFTLPGSLGTPAGVLAAAGLPGPSALVINPTENINFRENDWWTSHEVSLSSTTRSPFQYIIGAIYYFQQYSQPTFVTAPGQANLANPIFSSGAPAAANPSRLLVENNYQLENQEAAGYAQLSYKITDQIKITGSLRYTYDNKSGSEEDRDVAFNNTVIDELSPLFGAFTPGVDVTSTLVCPTGRGVPGSASCLTGPLAKGVSSIGTLKPNGVFNRGLNGTSSAVTGGFGIEYTPTPDIFVYARYNRGYAPLSFNAGFVSSNPEVAPEFVNSYEVGYKQNINHQLSFDVAAYYIDYDDIQLPITVNVGGVNEAQYLSVPKAESTGIELEGTWNPIRDLIFTLSYSYDYTAVLTGCSGRISGGVLTPSAGSACIANTEDPAANGPGAKPVAGQVFNAATNSVLQSIKGNALPNAPRNKIAFTGAYTWHFDPGQLTLAGTYVWRDSQVGDLFDTPYNTAPSWSDVDLRAVWSGDHDRYELIAYAKNIFNTTQYSTGAGGQGLLGNASVATTAAQRLIYVQDFDINPPRTFGVEVRYKFF
jgi:iron complex outermembrane recepter protein